MSRVVRLLLWLVIVAWLSVDLYVSGGPVAGLLDAMRMRWGGDVVATAGESSITRSALSEALREALWRHGEEWSSLDAGKQGALREQVLARLIDEQLLTAATAQASRLQFQRATTEEELNFTRMQAFEAGRLERTLSSQGLTLAQVRAAAESYLVQQAFLESESGPIQQVVFHAELPPRYHAAHLFLSAHEKDKPDRTAEMQVLADQLATGTASFADLVAKHSDDARTKERGGDLGWFSEARMPADFMQAVKTLKPGELGKPVRTALGWHVIKLLEIKPAEAASAEALREEAAAMLRNRAQPEQVKQLLAGLRRGARIVRVDATIASTVPEAIQ